MHYTSMPIKKRSLLALTSLIISAVVIFSMLSLFPVSADYHPYDTNDNDFIIDHLALSRINGGHDILDSYYFVNTVIPDMNFSNPVTLNYVLMTCVIDMDYLVNDTTQIVNVTAFLTVTIDSTIVLYSEAQVMTYTLDISEVFDPEVDYTFTWSDLSIALIGECNIRAGVYLD
jgi:hypothetical protein